MEGNVIFRMTNQGDLKDVQKLTHKLGENFDMEKAKEKKTGRNHKNCHSCGKFSGCNKPDKRRKTNDGKEANKNANKEENEEEANKNDNTEDGDKKPCAANSKKPILQTSSCSTYCLL